MNLELIEAKKEKARQRAKAWYHANKERAYLYAKEWKAANPEKSLAYQQKWKSQNQPAIKAANIIYNQNNADKGKARAAKWRLLNIDLSRSQSAEWSKANPEKRRESAKLYRERHPEKAKLSAITWQKANRDKASAASTAWSKANPEARRIINHNRRARIQANGGTLSRGLVQKLMFLQKSKCACCRIDLKIVKYHLDHQTPLFSGGKNIDSNMQLLCATCNCSKSTKDPIDFMQSRGFLL